jgi:hypothetical protein
VWLSVSFGFQIVIWTDNKMPFQRQSLFMQPCAWIGSLIWSCNKLLGFVQGCFNYNSQIRSKIQGINWRKCIFRHMVSLAAGPVNNLSPYIFYIVPAMFWRFKIIYLSVVVHSRLDSLIPSFVVWQFLKFISC